MLSQEELISGFEAQRDRAAAAVELDENPKWKEFYRSIERDCQEIANALRTGRIEPGPDAESDLRLLRDT